MQEPVRERSVSELAGDLLGDVQRLLRDEVRLARAELTESAREILRGSIMLAAAGFVALLGVIFVGVAVFYAIFLALPGWAAALLTATAFFILAGILYLIGRSRLRPSHLRPEETIRSLEEDREWLQRHRT
ncbi:MAG: phage holin family protein [Anaerolineae bacterium]